MAKTAYILGILLYSACLITIINSKLTFISTFSALISITLIITFIIKLKTTWQK